MVRVEKDKRRSALDVHLVFRPAIHEYTGNRKLRYYRPPDSPPDKANDRLQRLRSNTTAQC